LDSCCFDALLAAARSALALSAADRPSAIFFARSSSAAVIGGQTNFIVNPTRIRNTIIWMMRVPVMLTFLPQSRWRGAAPGWQGAHDA
jgi:hypothetical protein